MMGRRTAIQLEATRTKILAAAEKHFAERGFARTQIAEIAAEAGVGISSFYRQFPDKQALLGKVLQRLFDDVRTRVAATRSGMELRSPIEQLLAIQRTYDIVFEVFARHPDVTLTMLRSGYGTAIAVDKLVWDSINELVDDIVADLARAASLGTINLPQKQAFGDAVIGMVLQMAHRMLVEQTMRPADAAAFCTRMTLGALLMFMDGETQQAFLPLIRAGGPMPASPATKEAAK